MSVNKVILIGNVGKDPEVRYLDANKVVAKFTLATNERYKDRNGNNVDQTEWHTIEMWDELAKLAEKYVKKGKSLYIEGKIKTEKWTDKETNQERQTKIIRANQMTFLSSGNSDNQGAEDTSNRGGNYQNNTNTAAYNNNAPATSNAPVYNTAAPEPMPEDDLPF